MTFFSATQNPPVLAKEKASNPLRTAVRFPLRLPIHVQVGERVMPATTEDISANGALFSMTELPPLDAHVAWTLCLPAEIMGGTTDVTVHCTGRVVRHGSDRTGKLVGVLIDEYTFKEETQ